MVRGRGELAASAPIFPHHNPLSSFTGAHSGSYCIYKALAVAAGVLDPHYRPKVRERGEERGWKDVCGSVDGGMGVPYICMDGYVVTSMRASWPLSLTHPLFPPKL